ncbi:MULTISPECIES: AAA family ATPase [unclassified Variovorax]|uniref:AAA family ATPase n=1 Tax=unclassified Variovorax TaxID=663243 RepID=UPI00076CCCB8|nr:MULTISPECIES: AAA family ATPase [unclassified Variovorax]KWT98377.1 hypothetical protein APY03_0512 [Variovorax sp. WDL1]PNG49963.1 Denitrification regulatory protein NirQ [Variovorax sp. B2]PNG50835.1 Denitrification regulatory protein NirQ [Variovorax sp. B4]VTV18067.1 Denitrification regulatory protein NirQ [Variovorax sp. WDL1]
MQYNKTALELDLFVNSSTHVDGTVTQLEKLFYPFEDITDKSVSLAAAYRARVTTPTGDHTVFVSYRELAGAPTYNLWCGDKFSEGKDLTDAQAKERCKKAAEGTSDPRTLIAQMMSEGFAKMAESTGCNFWRLMRSNKICKHVETFLFHLKTNNPDFANELATDYKAVASGVPATAAVSSKHYTLVDLAFRVPVLYEGDRGAGKTFEARAFARSRKLPYVECPGHEGIEAPDLLGFLVPYGPGQMVWKDGPLSEAFRKAQKGKTVLVLDEILRIPNRELSILLTAFSPDNGVYRLRTGRIVSVEDGIASEETLECPVENLCVVATTNVGSEYAVDDCDPALAERFIVLRKDTNEAELKRILTGIAVKNRLSATEVTKALKFFKHMGEAMNNGLVKNIPTTRTMARAFELAVVDEDVVKGLRSQILLWVARTSEGKPVAEQVTFVTTTLDKDFP